MQRIPGVEEATVTFMTQKMTIVAPDDKIEAIVEEATKLTKKLEGDVVVKRIK